MPSCKFPTGILFGWNTTKTKCVFTKDRHLEPYSRLIQSQESNALSLNKAWRQRTKQGITGSPSRAQSAWQQRAPYHLLRPQI